jgi:hypothetical protein
MDRIAWQFCVSVKENDGEAVGIVGNVKSLGNWFPDNALLLNKSKSSGSNYE